MKFVLAWVLRVLSVTTVLLAVVACSNTHDAWQTAVRTDTPDAYEAFLERNPASEYAEQARTRRDALIDERDWTVARRENTAVAYAKYLEVHPEGVWSELASERRDALAVVVAPSVVSSTAPAATPANAPAAATSAKPVPVAPAAPAAPTPTFYLQLGAFSTAASARQSWTRLQRSFAELAEVKPLIDEAPLRGSSLYRLRVAVATQEQADRLCAALVRGGADCIKSAAR